MSEQQNRPRPLRVLALVAAVALGWLAVGCTAETRLQVDTSAVATAAPTPPPAPTAAFAPTPTPLPDPTPPAPTPTVAPSTTVEPEATPDVGAVLGAALESVRTVAALPPGASTYDEFVDLTDDDALIAVQVPVEWTDTDGSNWKYEDELIGPALSASPDLDAFVGAWGTPGMFLAASDTLTDIGVEAFLDRFSFDDCTYEGRHDYNDGLYMGLFDAYVKCGPEESVFLQVVAAPADGSYLIEAQFLVATDADWLAVERAINTFTAAVATG